MGDYINRQVTLPTWGPHRPCYALINWNPDPSPTPGLCGAMWGICLAYSRKSGSEVGIWLIPSFLTVICSRDHWYFDVLLGRTCFEIIWLWKVSFLIVFPFISLLRLILCDFALSFHGLLTGNCYCYSKLLKQCRYTLLYLLYKEQKCPLKIKKSWTKVPCLG